MTFFAKLLFIFCNFVKCIYFGKNNNNGMYPISLKIWLPYFEVFLNEFGSIVIVTNL